jgi:hypothetical protein
MSKMRRKIEMKAIKSKQDIETLTKEGTISEKVIEHISDYFTRLLGVYGDEYDPREGFLVLLEKGDPIFDKTFLEEQLCIRGGENLVSMIKEFVDYSSDVGLFTILVVFSSDFAMSYMVPDEADWVELIDQLRTFNNDDGNNSDK